MTRILGIETSCDETAAAVVDDGRIVRSSVVSSQADLHARFGGVVPEVASRAHVEVIDDVIAEALVEAGVELADIDVVAAVHGPGLAGALIVGVSAAKALSVATGAAVRRRQPPRGARVRGAARGSRRSSRRCSRLIVSGGHTLLVAMEDHGKYRVLGQTVDDAAGEAFDKVARFLGLGYPGGPLIDRLAPEGDPAAIAFPRPMLDDGDDFSFSGLKTAVVQWVRKHPGARSPTSRRRSRPRSSTCSSPSCCGPRTAPASRPSSSAAGSRRTRRCAPACSTGPTRPGLRVVLPSPALCTDNAAMVAAVRLVALRAPTARPRSTTASTPASASGSLPACGSGRRGLPGRLAPVPLALDAGEC